MNPPPREKLYTLPNFLTLLRIIFVPVIIVLGLAISGPEPTFANRIFSFFGGLAILLAAISDFLDGYLARKWKIVTRLGVLFDPLADKLVILIALLMMIPLGRVPAWAVALFLLREMAVTSLRGFAAAEGMFIEATMMGKTKAVIQSVAAGLIFLYYPYFSVNWYGIGMVAFWLALALTLISGGDYFYRFFREEKARRNKDGQKP
jgi:CDP-diacylglycerol--glycerol-3-phosphate 3-phosphatidyltransferase